MNSKEYRQLLKAKVIPRKKNKIKRYTLIGYENINDSRFSNRVGHQAFNADEV